jgi:hypothetical protein
MQEAQAHIACDKATARSSGVRGSRDFFPTTIASARFRFETGEMQTCAKMHGYFCT